MDVKRLAFICENNIELRILFEDELFTGDKAGECASQELPGLG